MSIENLKWKCECLAEPLHLDQPWALTAFLQYYIPAKISAQFFGCSAVAFCLVFWTLTLHLHNIEIGKCLGKITCRFLLTLLFSFLWDFFPLKSQTLWLRQSSVSLHSTARFLGFFLGLYSLKTGNWQVYPGTKPEWIWSLRFFPGIIIHCPFCSCFIK